MEIAKEQQLQSIIRELVNAAAAGVNSNEFNADLQKLIKVTASTSEQATRLLKRAINERLAAIHSPCHIEASFAFTSKGQIRSGILFIVNDATKTINKALKIARSCDSSADMPVSESWNCTSECFDMKLL